MSLIGHFGKGMSETAVPSFITIHYKVFSWIQKLCILCPQMDAHCHTILQPSFKLKYKKLGKHFMRL